MRFVLTHERTFASVLAVTLLVLTAGFHHDAQASSAIAKAARNDDLAQSRQLLADGIDANLPEPDGTTPLLWAVYNNSLALVQMLLEAGADPDMANQLDLSPLVQASRYGNAEMIALLLDHGASLERPDLNTEPAIMAAARSGNLKALQLLLDAGADPNATEPVDEQTAIMWATAEGHIEMVQALLKAGANPNQHARVNALTERKNADFPSGGFVPLHWASRNGDEAMMRLLLENGADINARNGDGSTPMMLAIVNDRFDTAALLLELGADANDGSLFYITEMRDATTDWRAKDGTVYRWDHDNSLKAIDLTAMLLDAGADPNKAFKMQMHNESMCCDIKVDATPLYRAARAADIEGLELMIAHGADPNWKPATESKSTGIDTSIEVASRSALMMAINGGKGVGVSGGPNDLRNGPPEFREEGTRDPVTAVKMLLEAGADVSVRGPDEETALHVAVKALNPDIVRALVEYGADMNATNKDGKTALEVVEAMDPPAPRPGFYFEPPPAQPIEIAVLLRELAGQSWDSAQ